jgi:hypothetical protein
VGNLSRLELLTFILMVSPRELSTTNSCCVEVLAYEASSEKKSKAITIELVIVMMPPAL